MDNILFIGTGNMASAISNGIISSGIALPEQTILYDKNPSQYSKFHQSCIKANSLSEGFASADFVFLSVKPQNIREILDEIKLLDYKDKVFISICAGITIESIEKSLPNASIIRTMPNTPLLIGQGVTAVCRNNLVDSDSFEKVKKMFASSGKVYEIMEEDINALTALTSSSPAYVYLFAKALQAGAQKLGFNYKDTVEMICSTLIGSANMILSSEKSLDDLIAMVKSPNGTTEKALNVFENKCFIEIVCQAMDACAKRAEELSKLN